MDMYIFMVIVISHMTYFKEKNSALLSHQTGNQSGIESVRFHLCREEYRLPDGGDQLQSVCLYRSVSHYQGLNIFSGVGVWGKGVTKSGELSGEG